VNRVVALDAMAHTLQALCIADRRDGQEESSKGMGAGI
jgi:hypothetical protein